jgi:hypothetical protein
MHLSHSLQFHAKTQRGKGLKKIKKLGRSLRIIQCSMAIMNYIEYDNLFSLCVFEPLRLGVKPAR